MCLEASAFFMNFEMLSGTFAVVPDNSDEIFRGRENRIGDPMGLDKILYSIATHNDCCRSLFSFDNSLALLNSRVFFPIEYLLRNSLLDCRRRFAFVQPQGYFMRIGYLSMNHSLNRDRI